MIKNSIFSIFFFTGIVIISIIFLPALFLPQKIVLLGGKLMGYWTGFCLRLFLSTKIIIKGTENIAAAYDGAVWPARLIGFGVGIILFSILTWIILGEKIEIKSAVCVLLAFCILIIQLFWK